MQNKISELLILTHFKCFKQVLLVPPPPPEGKSAPARTMGKGRELGEGGGLDESELSNFLSYSTAVLCHLHRSEFFTAFFSLFPVHTKHYRVFLIPVNYHVLSLITDHVTFLVLFTH